MTGGVFPPIANPADPVPAPPNCCLAVFKSLTSVQLDPFHCSVFATLGGFCEPPNAKADV